METQKQSDKIRELEEKKEGTLRRVPKYGQASDGRLELTDGGGKASSSMRPPAAIMLEATPALMYETTESEVYKRNRERSTSPSGSRDKIPRVFNVVIGRSGEDKTGGVKNVAAYEEEMRDGRRVRGSTEERQTLCTHEGN